MGNSYPQAYDGDWIYPKRKDFRLMCCDCGLVHRINFRLVKHETGSSVEFQVFRDNRATAAARRRKKRPGRGG